MRFVFTNKGKCEKLHLRKFSFQQLKLPYSTGNNPWDVCDNTHTHTHTLTWVIIIIVGVWYPAIPQHRIATGIRHDLISISVSPVDIPVSSFFCYWRWLSIWLQMRGGGKCGRCITAAVGLRRLGKRLRLWQAVYPMLCRGLRSFAPKNISVSCRRNTDNNTKQNMTCEI